MKQCPMRWIATTTTLARLSFPEAGAECIGSDCALWIDDSKTQLGTMSLPGINPDGSVSTSVTPDRIVEAHHCGLLGRLWGRDDREG